MGHLVNAHHSIYRIKAQALLNPFAESFIQRVIGERANRDDRHIYPLGNNALPAEGIHLNLMTLLLTAERNLQEVSLQAAVREVLVQAKRQLQLSFVSLLRNRSCNACHTISGEVCSKQGG